MVKLPILPLEELDLASRSLGADTLDHYEVASSKVYDAYIQRLLNRETLLYEIDTHHPRLLDTTIDLDFLKGEAGVFL